jgi:hypothetical protein
MPVLDHCGTDSARTKMRFRPPRIPAKASAVGSAEYRSLEVAENLKRSGEAAATSGRFSRRRMPYSLKAAIDPPALGCLPGFEARPNQPMTG